MRCQSMSRMIHSSTRPHSILVINWPLRGIPLPINLHSHDSTEKSGRGFTSVTSKYSCQSSCVADIMVYCDFEYRLCSMEVGSSSRDLTPRVTIQSHSGSCGSWISSCFKRVLYWHGGARQRKQHPYHYRGRMIRCRQTSAHKSARIILSHHQLCPGYVCSISLEEDVRWYGKTDYISSLNDNRPLISWFLNQPIKMHAWLLWI